MKNFLNFLFISYLVLYAGAQDCNTNDSIVQKLGKTAGEIGSKIAGKSAEYIGRKIGQEIGMRVGINAGKSIGQVFGTQLGVKMGAQIGVKLASVGMTIASAIAGAILGGITLGLGFLGDAIQRDKCRLMCCPGNNLQGSWACKYQNKQTCTGSYSDYPGHGDHACWWNEEENRCEAGVVCRDKTFNFFALFGSVCPPCDECPANEPQWSVESLKELDLPTRFYVDPQTEYNWCAPRGSNGGCETNYTRGLCESSYADHNGDKNCVWVSTLGFWAGRCVPGPICDNARERIEAAQRLGLTYSGGVWRRNGQAVTYDNNYGHERNRHLTQYELNAKNQIISDAAVKANAFEACFKNCLRGSDVYQCAPKCVITHFPINDTGIINGRGRGTNFLGFK